MIPGKEAGLAGISFLNVGSGSDIVIYLFHYQNKILNCESFELPFFLPITASSPALAGRVYPIYSYV